jgi:hypothetical protein
MRGAWTLSMAMSALMLNHDVMLNHEATCTISKLSLRCTSGSKTGLDMINFSKISLSIGGNYLGDFFLKQSPGGDDPT